MSQVLSFRCIVIKKYPLFESDLSVLVFSRDYGLFNLFVKGGRKKSYRYALTLI